MGLSELISGQSAILGSGLAMVRACFSGSTLRYSVRVLGGVLRVYRTLSNFRVQDEETAIVCSHCSAWRRPPQTAIHRDGIHDSSSFDKETKDDSGTLRPEKE